MQDPWFYRHNTFEAIYRNPKTFLTLIVVFAITVIGLNEYYTYKNAISEGESILIPNKQEMFAKYANDMYGIACNGKPIVRQYTVDGEVNYAVTNCHEKNESKEVTLIALNENVDTLTVIVRKYGKSQADVVSYSIPSQEFNIEQGTQYYKGETGINFSRLIYSYKPYKLGGEVIVNKDFTKLIGEEEIVSNGISYNCWVIQDSLVQYNRIADGSLRFLSSETSLVYWNPTVGVVKTTNKDGKTIKEYTKTLTAEEWKAVLLQGTLNKSTQ